MLLFLFEDLGDGHNGCFVFPREDYQLMPEMPKYDTLNGDSCCSDSPATEQGCDDTEREPADGTQPVAATARQATELKLGEEDGSVPRFVRLELGELWH